MSRRTHYIVTVQDGRRATSVFTVAESRAAAGTDGLAACQRDYGMTEYARVISVREDGAA